MAKAKVYGGASLTKSEKEKAAGLWGSGKGKTQRREESSNASKTQYGSEWNPEIVNRPSGYAEHYHPAAIPPPVESIKAPVDLQPIKKTGLSPDINRTNVGFGVVPAQVPATTDDFMRGFFSKLLGGSANTAKKSNDKTAGGGIQTTDAGIGIGALPTKRAINQMDVALAKSTLDNAGLTSTDQLTPGMNKAREGIGIGVSPALGRTPGEVDNTAEMAAYMALSENSDFEANTGASDGQLDSVYLGPRYRYINDIGGMQDRANGTGNSAFDLMVNAMSGPDVAMQKQGMGQLYGNPYRLYDQMTAEEVAVLNYLVATQGEKIAERYLKTLEPTLTNRQAAEADQVTEDLAETPVLGSVMSVPLNAAGAMEGAITLLAGAGGKELTENDSFRSATRMASKIRDTVSGKMTPAGAFFYQTGMSMLDTAFRLPLGGGGLAYAGFSAASQTADQAIRDGATTEQALWLAGVAGSLEVITEKVSLDNLFKARMAGTLKQVVKSALAQGGIEASEEAAAEIGNIIADTLIRKNDSDWNQAIAAYMAGGMTRNEAIQKTLLDKTLQVGAAGMGGFVSGLFFGAGAQIATNISIGQDQGKQGLAALKTGSQVVEKLNRAKEAYKKALKTSPRYTATERVSIARDIEASGMSEEDKEGVSHIIDAFAAQPEGWLTEQGQKLTELAIKATRQAATRNYVASARMQATQTKALGRLNTLFSGIQAAYGETQSALESGDLAAHAGAIEKTNEAIEKYQAAFASEQAENTARKAQQEADARESAVSVLSAARDLQFQIPSEVQHHAAVVDAAEESFFGQSPDEPASSDAGGWAVGAFNLSKLEQAETGPEDRMRQIDEKYEREKQQRNREYEEEKERRQREDEERKATRAREAEERKTARQQEELTRKRQFETLVQTKQRYAPAEGELFSRSDPEYAAEAKRRVEKITEALGADAQSRLGGWYKRYQGLAVTNEDLEGTVAIFEEDALTNDVKGMARSGRNAEYAVNGFAGEAKRKLGYAFKVEEPKSESELRPASVLSKYFRADEAMMGATVRTDAEFENILAWIETGEMPLTTPAAADIVEPAQAAQAAPFDLVGRMVNPAPQTPQAAQARGTGGTFDLVGYMMNGSGTPRYSQANSGEKADQEIDVINHIVNGGSENGRGEQGERGERLLGQRVPVQAGERDRNRSGDSEKQRMGQETDTADRAGAGDARTREENDRGELRKAVKTGADWTEANRNALANHIERFNTEIAGSGSTVPQMDPQDVVPVTDVDTVTAKLLTDLSRFSGRKVYLYASKAGRSDLPGGFSDGKNDYVRYSGDTSVVFHNGHETAESRKDIRQAGYESLKKCAPDTLDRYIAMRAKNSVDVQEKDRQQLKKEFVCDMFGAYMYAAFVNNDKGKVFEQVGADAATVTRFKDAFNEVLAGASIEETDIDAEAEEIRIATEPGMDIGEDGVRAEQTKNSQFQIKGKPVTEYDPLADMELMEAVELHMGGSSSIRYAADSEKGDAVAGFMRGMERTEYNVRVFRDALDLYNQGMTPETYWSKDPKSYDNAVGKHLLGILQRNGRGIGGQLSEEELGGITKHALKYPQYSNLRLSVSTPTRFFETLGRTRTEKTGQEIAANHRDGVRIRDAIVGFADQMNGESALYERDERAAVAKAYTKKGTKRESALIDLLGQNYISEEEAQQAVFDTRHMVVPSERALYVFGKSALELMSDDQQTIVFDQKYRTAAREVSIALQKELTAAKSQNEYKRAIERAMDTMKRIPHVRIDGKTTVIAKGNAIEVYLPDGKLYARIEDGKHADMKITQDTVSALRSYYDRAYKMQNFALVSNGYPAMRQIKNYFPHHMPETGSLKGFTKFITSEDLPTWVNGTTATRKPGRPYTAHILERLGTYTNFDAIQNFNTYIPRAADLIYMTPVIQRVRQFERSLRQISKDASELGNPGARSKNSALVSYLVEYGNLFANKKPLIDRGAESLFGRKLYKVQDWMTRMFGASSVLGSVSVAMSNLIAGFEAIPTLNKKLLAKNTAITLAQGIRLAGDKTSWLPDGGYDGFADRIPFLASRRNEFKAILADEQHWKKFTRGASAVASVLFSAFDYFTTESVARTKYDMLMRDGYTEEAARKETSAYCTKLFANRETGMMPLVFKSRVLKPFMQFLLEPTNQMGHFRDMRWETRRDVVNNIEKLLTDEDPDAEKEIKKSIALGKWKDLAKFITYMLAMSLYGGLSRWTKRRDQTYNPAGLVWDFFKNLEEDGIEEAANKLGGTIVDQSVFGGFVGGGRVPVSGALENIDEAVQIMKDEDATGWQKAGKAAEAVAGFLPGGAQISKTARGIAANTKGGSYTQTGKLRYPITEKDFWRTILFGPSAAQPQGFDYETDTLSQSKTDAYERLIDEGFDPYEAYYMLQGYNSANNATKALSILTADSGGLVRDGAGGVALNIIDSMMGVKRKSDGQPDFKGKDVDVVAKVMGLSYDSKKDGSLENWAKDEAAAYKKKATKDGSPTPDQQKNIDAIELMMKKLYGK